MSRKNKNAENSLSAEWVAWLENQCSYGETVKKAIMKARSGFEKIPEGEIPSSGKTAAIFKKYGRRKSRNWEKLTRSSTKLDPTTLKGTEPILPEEIPPQAEIGVWRKVIADLIRKGKTPYEIFKAIKAKDQKITAIIPTKTEIKSWVRIIQKEINSEPKATKPKKPEAPKPAARKIPPNFGASSGTEFANVPGWILPEYRNGKEAKDPGTELDPAPVAETSYQAYGTLLMYAILNYWNDSKIKRFLRAYKEERPEIEIPNEETLQNWILSALKDLKFPELKTKETRESAGFIQAIQLYKKYNPWPESPEAFSHWNPASLDYSEFSFNPDED